MTFARLFCALDRHLAAPGAEVWNHGYGFSRCMRCDAPVVRALTERWHRPPPGTRVVWQAEPPPRAVNQPLTIPPAPVAQPNPLPAQVAGNSDPTTHAPRAGPALAEQGIARTQADAERGQEAAGGSATPLPPGPGLGGVRPPASLGGDASQTPAQARARPGLTPLREHVTASPAATRSADEAAPARQPAPAASSVPGARPPAAAPDLTELILDNRIGDEAPVTRLTAEPGPPATPPPVAAVNPDPGPIPPAPVGDFMVPLDRDFGWSAARDPEVATMTPGSRDFMNDTAVPTIDPESRARRG